MKKLISAMICAALIILTFCFTVSASADNSEIFIDNITGIIGDTVYVPVKISHNPGISDIAFSVSFDKSALAYKGYYKGALTDYTVYDHSSNGKLSFACIESKDNKDNGTLICFQFEIKKDAKEKTYDITLGKTYFANQNGKKIKIGVKNGSLKVSDICDGGHNFSEWTTVLPAACKRDGIKTRTCQTCGHTESEVIPQTGHTVEKTFTVDIIAKDGKPGMLSRHCTVCDAKTDIIVYTEDNQAALGINSAAEQFSDSTISNLAYFFNGDKAYPEIVGDNFDIEQLTASDKPVRNSDGSINVDVAADRLLRRIFGDNKRSGLLGAVKRAAMADEIPLRIIGRLIRLMFI